MALHNRNNDSSGSSTLRLGTINICGLSNRSKFTLNKFNDEKGIDLLSVLETGSTDIKKIELDNMDVITDANNAANKGAALYVNNNFSVTKISSIASNFLDSCWGLVYAYNKRIIVGSIYVKLNTKNAIAEVMKMLKAAQQKQTQLKATGIVLTGDFNARHVSWGDTVCNGYGQELFNSLDTTQFSICTSQSPTFLCANGSSVIDLSIISHSLVDSIESCVTDEQTELFSGAPQRGHLPLITDITLRSNYNPKANKITLDISKMNWASWNTDIENYIEENSAYFEVEEDPHLLWNKLNNIISESTGKHCPNKNSCSHSKPYWTQSLSKLAKSLKEARKCYTKRNTDYNRQKLNEARETFDLERKNSCQKFIMDKAKNLNAAQSTKFWKEFNRLFTKKTAQKVDPLDDGSGGLLTDQEDLEKTLFSVFFEAKHLQTGNFDDAFYREVNNIYDDIMEQMPNNTGEVGGEEPDTSLNRIITVEEILEAIKLTPASGKSTDNYNFHPLMLKNLGNKALNILKKLFNSCLSKHHWVWEAAEVIFLRKEGKSSYAQPGAYRPICITSYIGKLLEKILVCRIELFLIRNNLVDPDQEGFSCGKNTIRYLNRLHLGILKDKCRNLTVICLFVDFEKAFDSVWKKGLITKLDNLGIQGHILKLIQNFLMSRKVTLNVNGVLGNLRQSADYGLPQGSVISPLLFKLYIADFLCELKNRPDITLLKFADDGTVKITAPDSQTCIDNTKLTLNCLSSWTQKWRMKINCARNKTEIICFHTAENNKELIPKTFSLEDNDIHLVKKTKVLGLTIDEDLTYIPHSEDVLNSLNARWVTICKHSNRNWGFNIKVMSSLIKSLFLSKLAYASHIWMSKDNTKEINKLWYRIIKAVTGAVLNIKLNVAEVIVGIPPITIQTKVNSIKHFLKLVIKPVPQDRFREFITTNYNAAERSPSTLHFKFKDIFNFLRWKSRKYPKHFNDTDGEIVGTQDHSRFFLLSSKSCSYTKEMINKYIEEVLWSDSLRLQFQLEGYQTAPKPVCSNIPIPPNTSRETEVKLLSMLYKNNTLNSSLYKLGRAESPMCSACGVEEETAHHILFSCASVDEHLRETAHQRFLQVNEDLPALDSQDDFIGLLNAARDEKFVAATINILSDFPLRTEINLDVLFS